MDAKHIVIGSMYVWNPSRSRRHAGHKNKQRVQVIAGCFPNAASNTKMHFTVRNAQGAVYEQVSATHMRPVGTSAQAKMLARKADQPHRQWIRAHMSEQRQGPPRFEWQYQPQSSYRGYVGETHRSGKRELPGMVRFGHHFEEQIARHLDDMGFAWMAEPVRFAYDRQSGFQPDLYLPELDLYVEITQAHASHKDHKLEAMALNHPDVRVIALGGAEVRSVLELGRAEVIEMFERLLISTSARQGQRRAQQLLVAA